MAQVTITDHNGKPVATYQDDGSAAIGIQAQENGAPIPFSCGAGACRTCVGKVCGGEEFIDSQAVGPQHIDLPPGEILTCVAAIKPEAAADAKVEVQVENF